MKQAFFVRTGFFLAALVLLNYWLTGIMAFQRGATVAFTNFWGLDIYTVELLVVLAVLTLIWLFAVFRFWNWRG